MPRSYQPDDIANGRDVEDENEALIRDYRASQEKPTPVSWLPATLAFVLALLAFCALQVYSVLVGSWRWSISGLIVLFVGLLVGACLQSYANRRAK